MNGNRRVRAILACLFLVVALVLASCSQTVMGLETGPRAWVGGPPDGSEVPLGMVSAMCHAYAKAGVSHIELWVNGVFANRAPNTTDPSAEYFTASLSFETTGPGSYVLHCWTYDQDGGSAQSDPVTLRVTGEEPTPTTGEEEIPTASPTSTEVPPTPTPPPPTGTPVPPTTTRIPPTATPMPPTSTPTTPPQPPSITYFRANGTAGSITVNAGTKVTLSWEWQRVSEGYLDPGNTPMACPAMPCTYQVIPPATTTYTLRAVGPGGLTSALVTVVIVQGDTTGPTITRVADSPDPIYWHENDDCQPNQVTISARIADESGISAAKVTYRMKGGSWQSVGMSQVQTGWYSATIGANQLELSLNPPVAQSDGAANSLEYYVQAFDQANNRTDSPSRTVTVQYCYNSVP